MDADGDDDLLLCKLHTKCICREEQVNMIYNLLKNNVESFPNSLFVYGNIGVGKTHTVKTIFKELHITHAYVNCVEAYTPQLLYEKILSDFNCTDFTSCATMMDFIRVLKSHFDIEAGKNIEMPYILFDKAERLRRVDEHVFSAFLRIPELTGLNIGVIFITEIVLEKFFRTTGFYTPLTVHFSDYSKSDVISILELDCPDDYSKDFYSQYCKLVVDVFFQVCRDVKELQHLTLVNFSKYCEPVLRGELKENESTKLYQRMVPFLRKALQTVYLREVSDSQWENMGMSAKIDKVKVDLPYYAKYLLLAAYFASYNPANTDRRFFTKKSLGKLSKRTKTSLKAAKDPDKRFAGPKPFQMDRLMAIFYSIVPGGATSSGNILTQVSNLVSLNLLMKASQDGIIDAPKYKCVVTLDFVLEIGKQVDLDIGEYLYNYTGF